MTKVELLEQEVKDLKNRLDIIKKSATKTLEIIEDLEKQDKTKYSEEEVQVKLYECLGHFAQKHNIMINGSEIDQWFEQFKKK